eukprot:UN1585
MIGFSAAVATNVIECVQNVFSKRLLAHEYSASQLQFYTSLTALVLQAPLLMLSASSTSTAPVSAAPLSLGWVDNSTLNGVDHMAGNMTLLADRAQVGGEEPLAAMLSHRTLAILWVDGVLYHLQSVVAYVVMTYLSPVTVSVVNTLKRALLIWISVLVFGNPVTLFAKLGTAICLLGALWYNVARQSSIPRGK